MNIKDVSKREILDFEAFRSKIHDETFKPLDPKNQVDSRDRTGLHTIKREPLYDFVGYGDAVFNKTSSIEIPGDGKRESGEKIVEAREFEGIPKILKISDFDNNPDTSIQESNTEKPEDLIKKLSDFN